MGIRPSIYGYKRTRSSFRYKKENLIYVDIAIFLQCKCSCTASKSGSVNVGGSVCPQRRKQTWAYIFLRTYCSCCNCYIGLPLYRVTLAMIYSHCQLYSWFIRARAADIGNLKACVPILAFRVTASLRGISELSTLSCLIISVH